MIEVNLKSAFRLTRLVAPGMCARGTGSIINISSISGLRPQLEGQMYSTTKAHDDQVLRPGAGAERRARECDRAEDSDRASEYY